MTPFYRVAIIALTTLALFHGVPKADTPMHKANYELASQWTAAKVGKLVFDTSVVPHWLETGDRFWYSYETTQGRKFYLVDPHAKTKKLLFDNAKMAAMLTRLSLYPYDAQHLPITKIKFLKKDTVIQFELELPQDATIRSGDTFKSVKDITQSQNKNDDMTDKTQQEKTQLQNQTQGQRRTTQTTTATGTVRTLAFQYDLQSEKLTLVEDYKLPPKKMEWASVSPDEKTIIFARGHNLFMMDAANYALAQKKADDKNVKETQLTTDGEEHYSYARNLKDEMKRTFQSQEKERKDFRVPPILIEWSKDSKKFALVREDERKVGDLWVLNSLANPRPTLETYRYGMPGEENQPQFEIQVFDVAARSHLKVKADKYKDQTLNVVNDRILSREREEDKITAKWLGDTSDRLYFQRSSRDRHKVDVCLADTSNGEVTTLIEERLNTYIDTMPLHLLNGGKEILFWSERDGWGHWYLYDEKGKLKGQVTSGEYTCQDIVGIDEKSRTIWFSACGKEAGEDPYYTHIYQIKLDGTNLKLMNPGDSLHTASMNDEAKFFVDNSSRVDTPPSSQLRDSKGNLLMDLEKTDVSALLAAGYKYPETFTVKADDGITDLYGVIYRPFDFNPNRKYPIIAYVYPGPQTEAVTKNFVPRHFNVALAQFGFIVIEVGNRGGNPQRSKWYHNFGYGNLRDYGLADKKRAIEQLAAKYPYIDISRVGIYGHSGGGFMSAAAMLVYPDFFKVAVSESGNHENNIYNRWWSESHHGVKEVMDKDGKTTGFEYNIEKNSEIAKNLKGHLMLATGDIDDNVHPANTYRLANALIRANKRFDFFLLPGQRHGYTDMTDYFFWIRSDYFCRYLLGDTDQSVDILELNREREQVGDKRPRRTPEE